MLIIKQIIIFGKKIELLYIIHHIHVYILTCTQIIMNRIHLIHHYKLRHLGICIIEFEYT